MSNEIEKRVKLPDLTEQERTDYAYDCYQQYSKGRNYTQIAKKTGLTIEAVKKLVAEHARVVEKYRPETRTVAESQYRLLQEHFWDILDSEENQSALVKAKAMEGLIQVQTRLDKFYGHESPQMHVSLDNKTAADLIKEAVNEQNVSPADIAAYGEDEIIDMEEDDEDGY